MFKAVCFCIMAFVSPICFGGKKTYDVSSSFHEINRADVEIRTEKEHTCEDLETWCKYISQYECQGNGVGKKCPKTCNKCTAGEKYYVEDGCIKHRESKKQGSYQDESAEYGVRCCSMDGKKCATPGSCETKANDRILVSYADATSECSAIGKRLCTKDELNTGVCCGTGGQCDQALVWTSTPDADTSAMTALKDDVTGSEKTCSQSCAKEFNVCHNFQKNRRGKTCSKAYGTCRTQIDGGFHRLADAGCIRRCKDTEDMIDLKKCEGTDGDEGGNGGSPQTPSA